MWNKSTVYLIFQEPAFGTLEDKIEHLSTYAPVVHTTAFHLVEKTRTSSKCQKMKNARAKRAKILFFVVKYANLWVFCRRRRRGCLSSLAFVWKPELARAFDTNNSWIQPRAPHFLWRELFVTRKTRFFIEIVFLTRQIKNKNSRTWSRKLAINTSTSLAPIFSISLSSFLETKIFLSDKTSLWCARCVLVFLMPYKHVQAATNWHKSRAFLRLRRKIWRRRR